MDIVRDIRERIVTAQLRGSGVLLTLSLALGCAMPLRRPLPLRLQFRTDRCASLFGGTPGQLHLNLLAMLTLRNLSRRRRLWAIAGEPP